MKKTVRRASITIWGAALVLLWAGCGPKTLVDETQSIENGVWTYAQRPAFSFEVPDTQRLYNFRLYLSHSDAYEWENVYINLHTVFPDGQKTEFVKSIPLSDAAGNWLGSGWGSTKTLEVPLQDTIYFQKAGRYSVELEQFMRTDSLKGISALRFVVEDCGQSRKQ